MKVGVVLVNYQDYAKRYLTVCRDSLRAQSYRDFYVYIIDNASSNETLDYLKQIYPEAVILPRSDGNYCAANNVGMRQAIADGCDYLIAANMDTEFDANWLLELVLALEKNPAAGIAQSLILLHPDTQKNNEVLINSTGNQLHFLFFGFTGDYGRPLAAVSLTGYPEIKGYASGCSFIIRKEIFEAMGGYTEELYMYHDDIEVSLKNRLLGHKIVLAPRSLVYHKYEFERSVRMLYYMERNRALCFWSFYPGKLLGLLFLPYLVMTLGLGLSALASGWFKTYLKVLAELCTPRFWRLRRQLRRHYQSLDQVGRATLSHNFVGKIEFQEIANPLLKYLVNPTFNAYWQLVKKII